MRVGPPLDLARYARSQIEIIPAAEVGSFAYGALCAAFARIVNAHGDCETSGCQVCHELSLALEIVEAMEVRIGPDPDVPQQRGMNGVSPGGD